MRRMDSCTGPSPVTSNRMPPSIGALATRASSVTAFMSTRCWRSASMSTFDQSVSGSASRMATISWIAAKALSAGLGRRPKPARGGRHGRVRHRLHRASSMRGRIGGRSPARGGGRGESATAAGVRRRPSAPARREASNARFLRRGSGSTQSPTSPRPRPDELRRWLPAARLDHGRETAARSPSR